MSATNTIYVILKKTRKGPKEILGSRDIELIRTELAKLNESAKGKSKYYMTPVACNIDASQHRTTPIALPTYQPTEVSSCRNAVVRFRS